jgi:hypothetical protein
MCNCKWRRGMSIWIVSKNPYRNNCTLLTAMAIKHKLQEYGIKFHNVWVFVRWLETNTIVTVLCALDMYNLINVIRAICNNCGLLWCKTMCCKVRNLKQAIFQGHCGCMKAWMLYSWYNTLFTLCFFITGCRSLSHASFSFYLWL